MACARRAQVAQLLSFLRILELRRRETPSQSTLATPIALILKLPREEQSAQAL